jgi:hypothetical protein
MKRFIEGEDRSQSTLFPEHLDDYITEDNPGQESEMFSKRLRTRTKRNFVGRSCPQNGPRQFDAFGT